MKKTIAATLTLLAALACSASGDEVTFGTLPNMGALSGNSGSTIGWGFSLTNSTSYFLVVANSSFCDSGETPSSSTCAPHSGVYSDIIAGNATVVAPGKTATQTYNPAGSSGLGSFSIWSSATTGEVETGSIFVVYDLFDDNPFTEPATQIGGDQMVSAAVQVSVGSSVAAVPEPALPLFCGIMGFGIMATRPRSFRRTA